MGGDEELARGMGRMDPFGNGGGQFGGQFGGGGGRYVHISTNFFGQDCIEFSPLF